MDNIGRPCKLCDHPRRREVEQRVLNGESVTLISTEVGISPSGVYRHLRNHTAEELREALELTQGITPNDFVQRILQIADDAHAERRNAIQRGNHTTASRNASIEMNALSLLRETLGVDSKEVASQLDDGRSLARAIGAAARKNSTVAHEVIAALRAQGSEQLAHGLETALHPGKLLLEGIEK